MHQYLFTGGLGWFSLSLFSNSLFSNSSPIAKSLYLFTYCVYTCINISLIIMNISPFCSCHFVFSGILFRLLRIAIAIHRIITTLIEKLCCIYYVLQVDDINIYLLILFYILEHTCILCMIGYYILYAPTVNTIALIFSEHIEIWI